MMKWLLTMIGVLLLGSFTAAGASTLTNFTLDNVFFSDGASASGTFTLVSSSGGFTLVGVDIITTDGPVFPGATYIDGNYNEAFDTAHFNFCSRDCLAENTSPLLGDHILFFNINGHLSLTSPTPIQSGGENASTHEFFTRSVVGGSFDPVATPLPAALPLFAGGLGVVALLAGRRKRKNASALTAA